MILKTPILAVTVLLAAGCSGLGQKEQDLLERGEAALESGDLEEAELLFGNVVQAAPRYGRAWFLRVVRNTCHAWRGHGEPTPSERR